MLKCPESSHTNISQQSVISHHFSPHAFLTPGLDQTSFSYTKNRLQITSLLACLWRTSCSSQTNGGCEKRDVLQVPEVKIPFISPIDDVRWVTVGELVQQSSVQKDSLVIKVLNCSAAKANNMLSVFFSGNWTSCCCRPQSCAVSKCCRDEIWAHIHNMYSS